MTKSKVKSSFVVSPETEKTVRAEATHTETSGKSRKFET